MAEKSGAEKPGPSPPGEQDDSEPVGGAESLDFLNPLALLEQLKHSLTLSDEDKPEQLLEEVSVEGVIKFIQSDKCKNIVTLAGAGISTSAGIPDFRSPGTGLYDNLQKYDLPTPMAIFELGFFKENPEPFFLLAKELWPGIFKPTPCHYFLRLLEQKGLLLRHFTQNIDSLESVSGISEDRIVEAHGTFRTSHCLNSDCRKEYPQDWLKEKVFSESIPRCEECNEVVKPDIVFFGEALPVNFFSKAQEDIPACDLLIVMGTSLVVQPFASLIGRVKDTTPRLYINREKTEGGSNPLMMLFGPGFRFDDEDNYRDVFCQTSCDEGCQALADKLGWGEELKSLVESEHKRLEKEIASNKPTPSKNEKAKQDKPSTSKVDSKPSPSKESTSKSSPSKESPNKSGGAGKL